MAEGNSPLPVTREFNMSQMQELLHEMVAEQKRLAVEQNKTTTELRKELQDMGAHIRQRDDRVEEHIRAQEDFKRDVSTYVQEKQNINQPPQPMNPMNVAPVADMPRHGLDPVNDHKAFSLLLRNLPKYHPSEQRWPVFLRMFTAGLCSEGFNPGIAGIDQRLKYALYRSMDVKAVQMIGSMEPGDARVANMSYAEYAETIGKMFCPEAGTDANREEFYLRKQGKTEPFIMYLHDKYELYMMGWLGQMDFQTLRFEAIKGLANPEVRKELYIREINDWSALTKAVSSVIIGKIHQVKAGDSLSPDMDGLVTSYTVKEKASSADVNQLTAAPAEATGPVAGSQQKRCWDCGSHTHFHNSPHCASPGARKFWPQGRGRGQGGRGARGGFRGRGAGGRGSTGGATGGRGRWVRQRGVFRSAGGSVNQIDGEQDVYVWQEDSDNQVLALEQESAFLGEGLTNQNST